LDCDVTELRPTAIVTAYGVPQAGVTGDAGHVEYQRLIPCVGNSAIDTKERSPIARLTFDIAKLRPSSVIVADGVPQAAVAGYPADVCFVLLRNTLGEIGGAGGDSHTSERTTIARLTFDIAKLRPAAICATDGMPQPTVLGNGYHVYFAS
jgi:hypothetical protein